MILPIKQGSRGITKNRAEALDNGTILSFLFLAENKEPWDWGFPWCDNDPYITKAVGNFNRVPLAHFDGADTSWIYESLATP